VLANKRISSILKQSSSPYQGLYKKRTQCWNHEEYFTEVYSRWYEDERSNFRRVQSAVAKFSVNKTGI
jgi:hypothetical protein